MHELELFVRDGLLVAIVREGPKLEKASRAQAFLEKEFLRTKPRLSEKR